MEGIELIKDVEGRITEIRVDVQDNPELATEVYHLISALKRVKDTDGARKTADRPHKRLSPTAFNRLIRDAKASGEISEEEFMQTHPTWQRKEKLSLPS